MNFYQNKFRIIQGLVFLKYMAKSEDVLDLQKWCNDLSHLLILLIINLKIHLEPNSDYWVSLWDSLVIHFTETTDS